MLNEDYEPPEFLGRQIRPIDPDNMYFYAKPPVYNWVRNAKKPLKWYNKTKRRIKWGWQRITRGYTDRDMWNLYEYHADLIARTLRDYKEYGLGIPPMVKTDENGTVIRGKNGEPEVSYSMDEWKIKLNKMILAFRIAREVGRGELEFVDPKQHTLKRYEERRKGLVDIYGEDKVLTRGEAKLMKEGMQLYIEYFFALWT